MKSYLSCVNFEGKRVNKKTLASMWSKHIPSKYEYVQAKINQSEDIKSARVTIYSIINNCQTPKQVQIAKTGLDLYIKSQANKYVQEYEKLVANTKYESPLYRAFINFIKSAKNRITNFL